MPHHDYRPDLMGSAAIEPGGRFEAGSWQSFTLTYTCGKFGIDDRGSLKVAFRMQTDQSMIQCDDPAGPGYTTVETSTGIPLTVRCEHRRNTRPWGISLYVRCDRYLSEGDRIVIRFGDRRQGSPGLRLQTFVQPRFELRVLADPFASYEYIPLPDEAQPTIGIGPGPGVKWVAILPTLRRAGDRFRLCLKCEDRWGNPSDRVEGTIRLAAAGGPVDGLPETVTFRAGELGREVDGLSVAAADAGERRIRVLGEDGELLAESNPLRVEPDTPYRHYWSDLHGQSEETVGTNPARDYFAFARDRAFLDICGHQGNDFQITDAFWRELNQLTAEFNEPGRFVTLPGYEWSGNTSLGGDHNVWYRHEGRPIYRSCRALVYDTTHPETDCHSARDLLAALQREDALVTAHIGGRYADVKYAHDAKIEPSVEIHSAWGTFEWIVRDAFEADYRVGIVASSDGHDGRPGAKYPGVAEFGSYGGLTCHLLESLDRDHLVEAFRRRHHYATTGARIHLESAVELDSPGVLFHRNPDLGDVGREPCRRAIMGDIVRAGDDDEVTFRLGVTAPAPIERIELRDGLDTFETLRPYGESDLGRRIRIVCEGAHYRGRGRNVSWEGTATFEGARIERIAPVNFWNVEQLPRQVGAAEVAWRCVTTGGFSAIDVWLDEVERGVLRLRTSEVDADLELAAIGLADTRVDAGGLFKAVRVFRLPDENATRSMTLRRRVKRRRDADTRLYACVTLENGHQAWPSPIYLIA